MRHKNKLLLDVNGMIVGFLLLLGLINIALHTGTEGPATNNASMIGTSRAESSREASKLTRQRVVEAYGKLPLSFEANLGQIDSQVKFVSSRSGQALFLTSTEAVLSLEAREKGKGQDRLAARSEPKTAAVVRMKLLGANCSPAVSGQDQLTGRTNYFIGSDPAKWRANLPTYARVKYEQVYPGIDLVYYGNQHQLEYDLTLAPGAQPDAIKLNVDGVDDLEINSQGDLLLRTQVGEVRLRKPVVYQEVNGVRNEIQGGYVLKDKQQFGFQVRAYDTTKSLVIDPVLAYSSSLGGAAFDEAFGIAVDVAGNSYVTGNTTSPSLASTGAFQTGFGGVGDAFVAKFDSSGTNVYTTYLGGAGEEFGEDLTVDSAGNVYVTGNTNSTNFPTTPGAFQTSDAGFRDAFISKLDPAGASLVYSTYLGGSTNPSFDPPAGDDGGHGIEVDSSGNAYVLVGTNSIDFPTTPGAFRTIAAPGFGAAVVKLNPSGSALVYSTFLSGLGDGAIAIDAFGNAYIAGRSSNPGFTTTPGAFQTTLAGGEDAFVTKLNATGSAVIYSTLLGGNDDEEALGIAVDSAGEAYVSGLTQSSNFPVASAFQPVYGGIRDAFVSKLSASGTALVFSTYLGGTSGDQAGKLALDASGAVWVAGVTASSDFPIANPLQSVFGGVLDAFVAKLNSSGSLSFATYLGGNGFERANAIAVDSSGAIYLTGTTDTNDLDSLIHATPGQGRDAFVVKIIDFLQVSIDIKPGSFPNSVNLGSNGVVPVAIFSTATFDARNVDPSSVTLAGARVKLKGKGSPMASFEDVNGDGLLDLVVQVSTEALQLSQTDTQAILEGNTFSGRPIRGSDSVRIVP